MINHRRIESHQFQVALARVALLIMAATTLAGCHTPLRVERMPRMRWLVMPPQQIDAASTNTREIRGWWFSARTIRRNPRGGQLLADAISQNLANYSFINQFSPIDLRYYFADKRQMLVKAYPNLKDPELDDLLGKVPPLDYARELGADKLVAGTIDRLYVGENRTIHWWWALLSVELKVVDVRTGNVEFSKDYRVWQNFSSTEDAEQTIADRFVKDLERKYFRPMTKSE
jgi:hypothetical protein